jgi:hypothetical protein
MDDFKCPACGSPALVYPVVLGAGEPARVQGADICLDSCELKERSKRSVDSISHRLVSGC